MKKGFEILTESQLLFVRACIKEGVDGFYASTQGGEAQRYLTVVLPKRSPAGEKGIIRGRLHLAINIKCSRPDLVLSTGSSYTIDGGIGRVSSARRQPKEAVRIIPAAMTK
ncbi:MAG: hypothetical protein ACJ746_28115 [Bryobacteraceae bacterium]